MAAVPVLLLSALGPACDPCRASSPAAVGISAGEHGGVVIHAALCAGQVVTKVEFENESGTPLWSIVSSEGSAITTFVVGEVPAGFVEETAFEPPAPAGQIVALVSKRDEDGYPEGPDLMGFEAARLRPGAVFFDARNHTLAEFDEQARESCKLC